MSSAVYFNYRLNKSLFMHACWILLCMLINLVYYAFLLIKEGINKSMKSKGGLEGRMPQLVGGWGCYTSLIGIQCRLAKNL
jgi:hypothetical protein